MPPLDEWNEDYFNRMKSDPDLFFSWANEVVQSLEDNHLKPLRASQMALQPPVSQDVSQSPSTELVPPPSLPPVVRQRPPANPSSTQVTPPTGVNPSHSPISSWAAADQANGGTSSAPLERLLDSPLIPEESGFLSEFKSHMAQTPRPATRNPSPSGKPKVVPDSNFVPDSIKTVQSNEARRKAAEARISDLFKKDRGSVL